MKRKLHSERIRVNALSHLAGFCMAAPLLLALCTGPARATQCLEARWLFEGTGADETGQHHCTLFGDAHFVPTPGGQGLFTNNAASYAEYYPLIAEIEEGQIGFQFFLDDTFSEDSSYANPICIINNNRSGHLLGDFSVRLDPTDGKMWFVQENAAPEWTLRTNKDVWESAWYTVLVTWGHNGRTIRVYWEGGSDYVSDAVVAPCFSTDATQCWIASRASDSPQSGLTIGTLEVLDGPPLQPQGVIEPDVNTDVPLRQLGPSYPNPSCPETVIEYAIRSGGHTSLRIYDTAGKLVRTLVNEVVPVGNQAARWDGRDDTGNAVASGVYFYRLETDGYSASRKMVLAR